MPSSGRASGNRVVPGSSVKQYTDWKPDSKRFQRDRVCIGNKRDRCRRASPRARSGEGVAFRAGGDSTTGYRPHREFERAGDQYAVFAHGNLVRITRGRAQSEHVQPRRKRGLRHGQRQTRTSGTSMRPARKAAWNASTTLGSQSLPAPFTITSRASNGVMALR